MTLLQENYNWVKSFASYICTKRTASINTFASKLIQAVRVKTPGSHMDLRGNFSGPVSATDLVKSSNDSASLVALEKNFWLKGVDLL